MRNSNFIKIILFTVAVLFFDITFSQYSKSHYIPPITSTGDGPAFPLEQYLYVSTPSESPVNVTIRPIGSEEITGLVSNSNPWAYFIGTGNETNLMVNTNSLNGSVFDNKGFIVESDNLIYVSVRLFSGGNYQAGTIVSKGTAALGTEFRAGSFENQGFLQGGTPSNYLNFISVLASRDNTTVNFSSFGNGVNILNNQPTDNILLNAGESYSVAISPFPSPVNEANAQGLIGALVTSDKPIAVNTGSFTGSNSNYNEGGGQDIGIDQIVPSTIIGNEYIFVRGLGPDEVERPLIVAHEDNTAISVNGNLETVLNAGDFYSIPSTYYGVSYSNTVYDGFGNVNDDGYPETIDGIPINPFNNADDQPPTNQSSNMYVSTSKPVFAYQVVGGIRPGSQGAFGITNGVANVGLFFVPPLNCKTPSSVNNIPDVSQIGNEIFGGIITIVSEAGAEITINGSPISNYAAFPEPVQANPLYESYTIEGLIGDVSIESTAQVYVATFGAYEYATFGGYYSGFEFKPEIILDNLDNDGLNCIPNLTLSLSSISTYDEYQWFYNGDPIVGANSANYTPSDPGYYQISGLIANCEGSLLSNNIPVSDCPKDSDNDGVNDNIDIDNDNDGITDCNESLGDQNLTLNPSGGNLENIGNYSINLSYVPESPDESGWIANDGGFTTNVPIAYIDENVEKSPGQTISQVTFDSEVSLEFYFDISEGGIPMDDDQWYSIAVPFDKTITLLDPNDELRIDSNFDGIFESGITEISNFNIRFKANDENLTTGSFSFKTHLTNYFEFQNYNNSLNDLGGVSFKVKATCVPKDSDLDGIVDARDYDSDNDGIPDLIESQGNNFSPLSGIDVNNDGYDDIFSSNFNPLDFDEDTIPDYLDLDSDNDGIYDLHESGALDFITDNDLDGLIDEISVGSNGLSNELEEIADNSNLVFSVNDFDDDSFYNYIDLDSENDGCYDVIEAGFTETDDDGILGDGEPIIDLNNGKVQGNIGYDFVNENYQIAAPIIIDLQPEENITVCENNSFSISFETSTFDTLQWQISYPSSTGSQIWDNLPNNLFFSGSNEKTLQVIEPQLDLNNVRLRALIQRNGNSCDLYTSETLLNVNPNPTVIIGPTYEVCDDDYDGIGSYDLSTLDETLLDGQTGVSISYYESQEDADNATNVLDVNYQNTVPDNQTLYVRLEIDETGCYATTTQELIVNPIPTVLVGPTYEVCDDDYDGIGSYDLSTLDETLLDGQTGVSISYYESQEDADNATNVLDVNYQNTVPDNQTLYVRLEVDETGCYATTTQELIVNPLPEIIIPSPLEECDDDYDGIVSFFDLDSSRSEILQSVQIEGQNQSEILVNEFIHTITQAGEATFETTIGKNYVLEISGSISVSGNPQGQIDAAFFTEDSEIANEGDPRTHGCIDGIYSSLLCDNPNLRPEPDQYDSIDHTYRFPFTASTSSIFAGFSDSFYSDNSGSLTFRLYEIFDNLNISYHETLENAESGENPLEGLYTNIEVDTQTLYVRLEIDETGCYATTTQELIVNPIPTVLVGPTYEVCDDDYDGIGSYDLSTLDETLLDGQTGVSISYYESQEDADNATNVLDVNYQNTVPDNQTLYVRLEIDETGCYATTTQELIVNPLPEIIIPSPLEECDDDYDGIVSFFDLSQKTEEILNGQTGISVSYFETLENAESGENPIEGLYTNIEVDTQTLYVRLEIDETGCYATTTQELIVNPIPTVLVGPTYEVCDDDYDGIGSYDLSTLDETLLDGQTGVSISYYESQEDADNATNVLDVNYQNTVPDNQTLYVRLEIDETGCYATTTQELIVNPIPTVLVGPTYEVCDDDYDGIGSYDLSTLDETLLDGQTGVSISYYESQEDADNATNVLDVNYQNTVPDNQTLYVRLEIDETGCYATTTQELIVNPIPTVLVGPTYEVCDDDYDGIGSYDLSTLDETLLDGQTGVSISYYESQEDADNATNVLDVNYQNTVPDNQTLYVRLEIDETGCYATTTQELIVHPLAVIEVTDYELCDYTNPGDLIEVFDITTKSDEIINGQDVVLTYFTSLLDSQNNTNPISNEELVAYSNTEPTETIYVTLEQNTTGCITYGSFDIIVNPLPNVIENTDLVQCDIDDVQDGISIYNLEEAAENIVIGDDPNNYVLTFHLSQEDLDAGINAIEEPTAYVNETPLQNIYCRVENINTGCYTTSYFYLETVFNPIPDDAGLVVCDDSEMNGTDADYNGLGLFTLSDADEYVLSLIVANPNNDITDASELTVTYYLTEQDALLELNQLPNEYISEVPNQQVIYLRVERGNDCFGINSMLLEVLPVPSYVDIPDQILCSMTPGFFDIFLSDYDVQVLNGQNPDQYTITYHTSVDDAENGVNALENAYTVVDQVDLFVRVEDNITACYISNIDFTLTVEPKPLFTPPDQPIIVCDEDTDGFTTIDISIMTEDIMRGPDGAIIEENIVTYHETAEDMNLGTNAIEDPAAYVNITNPQTLYVRIEDNMTASTGCYGDTTLEIIVETPPVVNDPSNLEYCDPDADGFGVFDLTTANAEIANGLENLVISYHETEADAENNVNAIVGEYNNIVAYEQTVYIRVEDNASDNDCASQLTLTLIVNDVPQIDTEPSSLFLCDDNTDGFGIFDLSASSEELLNGLDPSDFTITYYEAEDDAQNGLNAIVTPYNYTNTTAFNQFVWVRIENSTTACYNVGSIELIVNELPVLTQPSPLNLCDDNNSGDEVEGFTLEDSIGEVLQGQTGINISFHESQEDADNAVNALVSPYNNTANAQTIYVRGEDEITGCYATITLDLRVNPIPSPVAPEPIEECDDDNDGFTFFTLETNEEEIINGELDIILSYYSTLTNAQNDVNPIISPYYNIVPDNQIIYVRAENELTGCFTIVEQELITIYSPEIPLIIEDIVACDDDYDDIALFDLTEREEDILGEQSSSEMILTYHESLLDAETGDSPIINTTSYQNLSNPQTIYVRLEDTVNGCVNIGTFNLVVTLPPVIVQAEPLQECDDEIADQITEFDLTIKDNEITGGNIDWEVIYYETQQDAFNAINPIENPEAYSNTSVEGNPANPQTLYVAVVNEFGCIAYNYLTIEVLPTPTPNLDPSNIEQCDNNNAGDLIEIFDITVHEDYILNGESGVSIAYHESLEDALSGINPIADPSNYANVIPGVQTVYVAVTKDITGCPTVVTFDIIVNPLPDISTVADIVICEVNTDNVYEFNLDEITVQLLGSQDISNFTVTYHVTQQDAEDGLNVLTSPYANTSSPQQLFVNISNNTTGCFVTGAGFTLDVQEAAVANTDAEPAVLGECDIDDDGFAEFILTELNNDILDGLDANDFTVSYYENLQDAEDSSNALPNNYTNTSSPQIIYVRLDNDTDPSSQCYDITTATLIVNELPFFSLEASYMGCENANGSEVVDSLMEINLPESEYDFEWYGPTGTLVATTSSYFPTMAGTYTATVTNELTGCQYSTTTEVYTSATAVVSAAVTTLAFAQEHVIQATATGIGDYEFRLDTGPWQLDGTFNNVSPGLHTVYVRDLNGCGIGTATVLVVDYPRFFTPNGDGYNDTWHIIGADLHPGLVASDIYIFDRYGKLLKKLDPQGEGWDGTYNGRPMPSTDYWFTIEYQIPALNVTRRFRAHFSLKR